MSHLSSTPLIARAILLAGVLLAIFALLSPSHHPAYAQQVMDETIEYPEKGDDPVAVYTAMDPEEEDITWSLDGDDMGDFSIDGGVLTFKEGPPDFEKPTSSTTSGTLEEQNTYTVVVIAADPSDTSNDRSIDSVTMTVKVTNVEEPGTVELSTLQPKQAVTITAKLTDDDGSINADLSRNPSDKNFTEDDITPPKWQWATSESPSGPWDDVKVIEDDPDTEEDEATDAAGDPAVNGTSATYKPRESDVGMYLRATATYSDGHGEDDLYTEDLNEAEDTARMTSDNSVLMADYVNASPVFHDQDPGMEGVQNTEADRSIAENTAQGTAVGDPVVATDIGADGSQEVLTYTMADFADNSGDAGSFTINERTGQISVGTTLDYEDATNPDHEYVVRVTAADPTDEPAPPDSQSRATIKVTIEVTDVDEDPTISDAARTSINFNENAHEDSPVTQVGERFTATDPEDDDTDLKWSLSGNDSARFEFERTTGDSVQLSFKSPPDYDAPVDSGRNNIYNVTVEVTDSGGNTDLVPVTVTIKDLEEPGTVVLLFNTPLRPDTFILQPEVGTRIRAKLTDPDGASNIKWQWQRGSTDIDGATSITYTPVEADEGNDLSATATYDDGVGEVDDVASESAVELVPIPNVKADDPTNKPPVFEDTRPTLTVMENSALTDAVPLGTVTATDDSTDEADGSDDTLSYTLSGNDATSFTIHKRDGEISVVAGTELDYEASKNTYTVTVKATDPSGATATATVTIDVTNVPEAPSIAPGGATLDYPEIKNSRPNTDIVYDYGATDPEDDDASPKLPLKWSLMGNDDDQFEISDSGVLTFMSPRDYEAPTDADEDNVYNVTVTVTDSDDTVATRIVTVTVTNVDEDGGVTLPALQPKEEVPLTATLTDPDGGDGDPLPIDSNKTNLTEDAMWQWARSSSARGPWTDIEAAEEIVATEAVEGVPAVTSNTETYTPSMADVGNYLRATATYIDGESEDPTDTKTAEVISDNMVAMKDYENTAPIFPDQDPDMDGDQTDQSRAIYENTAPGTDVGDPVKATDIGADGGEEILVYTLPTAYAGPFAIDRETGQISVGAGAELDYEDVSNPDHEYEVTVKATDPSGTASDAVTVTITVKDVQEAPKLAGEPATDDPVTERDHPESSSTPTSQTPPYEAGVATYTATDDEDDGANPQNPLKWSLSGADSDKFEIDTDTGATVALSFKASPAPDFEDPADSGGNNVYNVTVTVTDSRGRTDSVDVAVSVTNVEEDGKVTLSNRQPEVGVQITAKLTDPDDGAKDVTWQWSADSADIVGAKSASYTPVSGDIGKTLTATATYRDSATKDNQFTPEDESKVMAAGTLAPGFTVKDADSNNQVPVFPDQDDGTPGDQSDRATRYVTENTDPNNLVVINKDGTTPSADDPVAATDEEGTEQSPRTDILTYKLGGPDAGSFTIDRATGQISVGDGTKLDHETKDTYTVTVTATDPSLASDTIIVTINVLDVDEAPEIMKRGLAVSGDRSISYPERGTRNVATYTAAGADSAGATWSLSGDDAGDFRISSGGVLTFRATPDFENPRDQGGDNGYNVMVKASSGTITATRNVTVTVTNVNEDGTVTLSSDQNEIKVGVELTAEITDIDGGVTGVTWQWARASSATASGTPISGATAATYTPVEADVDSYLRATASYTDAEGPGKSEDAVTGDVVEAVITVVVQDGSVNLSPSQLVVGDMVTATLSDPDSNETSLAWQWARSSDGSTGWTDIVGATSQGSVSATYTTVDDDANNYLRATVTYMDSDGPDNTAIGVTANAVQAPTPIGTDGVVTLPQTQPIMGVALTASLNDPDNVVLASVSWQWARSSDGSTGWTNIAGATSQGSVSATYTPVGADVGNYLRATASYTDAQGPNQSASAATANPVDAAATTPIHKYDLNSNGSIERNEVLKAIDDFQFAKTISRAEVLELIDLYQFPQG